MKGPFVLRCDGCGCFLGEYGERIEPPEDAEWFRTRPTRAAPEAQWAPQSFRLPAKDAKLFAGTREEIEPFALELGWEMNKDDFYCPQCRERLVA